MNKECEICFTEIPLEKSECSKCGSTILVERRKPTYNIENSYNIETRENNVSQSELHNSTEINISRETNNKNISKIGKIKLLFEVIFFIILYSTIFGCIYNYFKYKKVVETSQDNISQNQVKIIEASNQINKKFNFKIKYTKLAFWIIFIPFIMLIVIGIYDTPPSFEVDKETMRNLEIYRKQLEDFNIIEIKLDNSSYLHSDDLLDISTSVEAVFNKLGYQFSSIHLEESNTLVKHYEVDFNQLDINSDFQVHHFNDLGTYYYLSNYGYLNSVKEQLELEELGLVWIVDYLNSYEQNFNYQLDFFDLLIESTNQTVDFNQQEFIYSDYLEYAGNWLSFSLLKEEESEMLYFKITYGYKVT